MNRTRIASTSPENLPASLKDAQAILSRGEVVAMPTETVYGLAGAAFDEMALTRIFGVKARPTFDPLIIHVSPGLMERAKGADAIDKLRSLRLVDAEKLSPESRKIALVLIKNFWPGPLTLILPKTPFVPDLATSGLPGVALRMPLHPVAQALIDISNQPLAAPSANRFGRISPTTAKHVLNELGDRIELILDGGPCDVGLESTVISVEPLRVLRPGGLDVREIEKVLSASLGRTISIEKATSPVEALSKKAQLSPGMLASHYSPRKPLILLTGAAATLPKLPESAPPLMGLLIWSERDAAICLERFSKLGVTISLVRWMVSAATDPVSEAGVREGARNLFARMRELDDSGDVSEIWAEHCPVNEGLGHAIRDRMTRAAHR